MHDLDLPLLGKVTVYTLSPSNEHEGPALAFVRGDIKELSELKDGPLVRMHSRCIYGDVFGSHYCDCGPQLQETQKQIAEEGSGIIFYMEAHEGRGAGTDIKAKAYGLSEKEGLDTVEAYKKLGIPFDSRQYGHCARFLLEHGIRIVRLFSNNPEKIKALEEAGIEVIRKPLVAGVRRQNIKYLKTKRDHAGHLLPPDLEPHLLQ